MSFASLAADHADSLLSGGTSASKSIHAAADENDILSLNGRKDSGKLSPNTHKSESSVIGRPLTLADQNQNLLHISKPKSSFLASPDSISTSSVTSSSSSSNSTHRSHTSFLFGGSKSSNTIQIGGNISSSDSAAGSNIMDTRAFRSHKAHHGKRVNTAFDAAGYARELLQALTRFRAQHRRTIDGRLCAAAFVHDHQTYTNCTDVTDPSSNAGSEWCYVEPQLLNQAGAKANWAYCTPVVDYDDMRQELDAEMLDASEIVGGAEVDEMNSTEEAEGAAAAAAEQ